MPRLFLLASIIGAACTATAVFRLRRLGPLAVPYFMCAWLTGELALYHLAWQAVATIVFVATGALTAWPGMLGLAITLASWAGLVHLQQRARRAAPVLDEALRAGLGTTTSPPRVPRPAHPFAFRHPAVERVRDIPYGDAGRRHCLDVYRPRARNGLCPALLQIHGGAWVYGHKEQQALPLMTHLAAQGWACVAANYRLSPRATFPAHLIDAKRALAWIRRYGPDYGIDPAIVIVTGGSAGGHLASLLALTPNQVAYQPGFEEVDTSVAGCVPIYGVYDFLDRFGVRGSQDMAPFLSRFVMKCSPTTERARWEAASPIAHVRADAPPFFVIHGTHDSLAYIEDAAHFVAALRAVSRQPVLFAEIDGAQHAFDIFHSTRSAAVVQAIAAFAEHIRR